MQKQLDEASKQCQRRNNVSVGRNAMLRKEMDESNQFPKSMADWKTSKQNEEIRELKANNIALKGSLDDTEKKLDDVKLSLDRGESREATLAAHSGVAGYGKCFTGIRGI